MNMCRKELKYYTDTQSLQTGLFDLNQGLKSWFKQKQKNIISRCNYFFENCVY